MNSLEDLRDLIIYQSQKNENISVEVLYDNEEFWLTQKSMGKLFGAGIFGYIRITWLRKSLRIIPA